MNNMDSIKEMLEAAVASGQMAGAATIVWRQGNLMQAACAGWRDIEAKLPVQSDTIFRIASLSKPITAALAMLLVEEGRFGLNDPITRWAPEFSHMRVLRDPDGPLDETVPANRPLTFDHLLTHRSGLTYGEFHRGPIATAYAEKLGGSIDTPVAPDDWIAALASLPLIDQPGEVFHYGHSTDLLGLLISRMEGIPLGEVFDQRVFLPLGMKDTGFIVPKDKWHRRAALYGFKDEGTLTRRECLPGGHALQERPEDMQFESGGQGLWSTADDFLAFARIFVEGGMSNGTRLLSRQSLALMTSNQLTKEQRARSTMFGRRIFASGHGYGMGVAVVLEPEMADPLRCRGGIGTVGWPGAYGGWWQADPNDKSVLIFLAHNVLELQQLAKGIGLGIWDAISRFQSLGVNRKWSPNE